ncbi:inositol monophosphatase family protein [Propionibacteriaceae bacterium Y1923]
MSANVAAPESTTAVRIIAAGGDAESARENTLAAVTAAVGAGATDVQVDVRTSRDGTTMVIRDATTLRLWGHPAAVADQSAEQLAGLGVEGTRIPTLAQVLDLLAEAPEGPALVVRTPAADAQRAWTTVRDHPASGSLEVSWRGDLAAVTTIRELDPDARVHLPHDGGDLPEQLIAELAPESIDVDFALLSPALVERARALGTQVLVHTPSDAEQLSWAIDVGADQVVTGRPRLLRQLATTGYSPLALAWAGVERLDERLGLGGDWARWIVVARQIAEWVIGYTRTASLGTIETKAHAADLVTAVDRAVEEHVRAVIAAELPDHLVIGEEFGGEPRDGVPTWWLDPVDGTANLRNHLPWTALSLALAIDGQPVVAVVAQPWTGEVFLAARGLGATLDGRPLQLARVNDLAGRAVMVESAGHVFHPGQPEFLDRLGERHVICRLMGSGTLAMARIAAGDTVAGIVEDFHPIDHLAGVLIAHEAGARVVNSDGDDNLFPAGGGMMVAAPGAAEKLWPLWQPQA